MSKINPNEVIKPAIEQVRNAIASANEDVAGTDKPTLNNMICIITCHTNEEGHEGQTANVSALVGRHSSLKVALKQAMRDDENLRRIVLGAVLEEIGL